MAAVRQDVEMNNYDSQPKDIDVEGDKTGNQVDSQVVDSEYVLEEEIDHEYLSSSKFNRFYRSLWFQMVLFAA